MGNLEDSPLSWRKKFEVVRYVQETLNRILACPVQSMLSRRRGEFKRHIEEKSKKRTLALLAMQLLQLKKANLFLSFS